jgi:hypothetical protein
VRAESGCRTGAVARLPTTEGAGGRHRSLRLRRACKPRRTSGCRCVPGASVPDGSSCENRQRPRGDGATQRADSSAMLTRGVTPLNQRVTGRSNRVSTRDWAGRAPLRRALGSATVRVLSVNTRPLLPTATENAPLTSRNSRELSARLGRRQHHGLVLSPPRLPVPPSRRSTISGTYGCLNGRRNFPLRSRPCSLGQLTIDCSRDIVMWRGRTYFQPYSQPFPTAYSYTPVGRPGWNFQRIPPQTGISSGAGRSACGESSIRRCG